MDSVIIFDGDDTLWLAEPLYDEARHRAAQVVAASTGLNEELFELLQQTIDLGNVTDFGLSRWRFPHSSVEAYKSLVGQHKLGFDPLVAEQVRSAAASVFIQKAPVVPGIRQLLGALANRYRLALLTQGDPGVQAKRVRDSGLAHFFDEIRIVERKTDQSFSDVLSSMSANAQGSWSVGNSLASDINPALRVGMSAIWIDRHVWKHERRDSGPAAGRIVCPSSLMEIPSILNPGVIPICNA